MVLCEQRDSVAGPKPERAKQIRRAIRFFIELAIRDDLARRRHDVRGPVRIALGVNSRMHQLSNLSRARLRIERIASGLCAPTSGYSPMKKVGTPLTPR